MIAIYNCIKINLDLSSFLLILPYFIIHLNHKISVIAFLMLVLNLSIVVANVTIMGILIFLIYMQKQMSTISVTNKLLLTRVLNGVGLRLLMRRGQSHVLVLLLFLFCFYLLSVLRLFKFFVIFVGHSIKV